MAVDAASGAVHSLDEVAYDAISLLDESGDPKGVLADKNARAEIASEIAYRHDISWNESQETLDDIEELCEKGLLWSSDPFEKAADEIKLKQSVLKAICLHVAHGCNMDCEYCFAGKGDYSGKSGIMSAEVGKRALDYLVEHSGSRKHLEVDFFGGEPLINWDVCKEIVAYGRELEKKHNKIFNFTLTTNGVLIDEDVIDFTNREMGNVVLSMDGRRETHDRMRKSKSGGGTIERCIVDFGTIIGKNVEAGSFVAGEGPYTNKKLCSEGICVFERGLKIKDGAKIAQNSMIDSDIEVAEEESVIESTFRV